MKSIVNTNTYCIHCLYDNLIVTSNFATNVACNLSNAITSHFSCKCCLRLKINYKLKLKICKFFLMFQVFLCFTTFPRGVMSSDMSSCQRGPMATYLTFEILVELFVRGQWGLKNIIEDAKDLNERPKDIYG